MNPSLKILNDFLDDLETVSGLSDHDVKTRLLALRDDELEVPPCKEYEYELLASGWSNPDSSVDGGTDGVTGIHQESTQIYGSCVHLRQPTRQI